MLYIMFSHALFIFLLHVDIRVICSQACMMFLAMPCLDLCVYSFLPCYRVRSMSSHAYMLGFTFLHVYVLGSTCLHACFIPICLNLCFHMLVCLDLWSLHALCYLPCACALHAMFVCLDLGYVCHAMCYCSPFVALPFFLAFWPLGSDPI